MRVGLLGGTFDPIHLGHLRAAETCRETLGLDRVLFVPAGQPPHRSDPHSSAADRWAMVLLATAHHPSFAASDLEVRREGPSYTVDTVLALTRELPGDALFLIVGSDTFPEMSAWRDAERLFRLCTVAVVCRPGTPAGSVVDPGNVVHVEGPTLGISGTAIRQRVREERSIRYLVPNVVADYIAKKGLYR